MCGRYTLTVPDFDTLAELVGVAPEPEFAAFYRPRYNVAPTDLHWLVREKDGRRELLPARFGLVNAWAHDASSAARQINARVETVAQKPAFRDAFARRHAFVPADGFYEWHGPKSARKAVWFHAGKPAASENAAVPLLRFAAIYETFRDTAGRPVRTFSILTTAATGVIAPVHDRMPIILPEADVGAWLSGELPQNELVALAAAGADTVVARPVGPRVGSVRNDDPACLEEAPEPLVLLKI